MRELNIMEILLVFDNIYKVILIGFTIIGGIFALIQWIQTNKLKRAEFLRDGVLVIRNDKEIADVLYRIDYGDDNWFGKIGIDHNIERKVDKTLSYFDYLCFLVNSGVIKKKEFRVFEYRIRRMVFNSKCIDYLYSLYHFSKKNGADTSFSNLIDYFRKNKLIDEDFFNRNSLKYNMIFEN